MKRGRVRMKPTEMEEYLFDLRGYLVLDQAIDPDHVGELNDVLDTYSVA